MKPTDDECFDVIRFCISYLCDKYSLERGLFRATVSQTDVRLLLTQIVQNGPNKYREDLDPHLVAEVLHTSLKDLRTPLMHEVYQDVLNTELVDDNFEANKAAVLRWMCDLPTPKLSIVKSYFHLLSRLVSLEDNDASLTQLAYTVAPAICRPTTSAYMSIRHMEDLKRIRPIIMFLMGNSEEVLKDVQAGASFRQLNGLPSVPEDKDKMLAEMMTSAMVIDIGSKSVLSAFSDEGGEAAASTAPFIRPPGLLVSIPTLQTASASQEQPTSMELDSADEVKRPVVTNNAYSDSEWRILHALVCGKMATFLEMDESGAAQFTAYEAASDSYCSVMQAWSAKQVTATLNTASPIKADISNVPVSPSSSIGSLNRATAMQKSTSRRSYRRKMVADCKALRLQIHDFEEEFTLKNKRLPKPQERGTMNNTYVKYRELKRDIRDNAAADVQRIFRGHKARMYIKRKRQLSSLSRSDDDMHRRPGMVPQGNARGSSNDPGSQAAFRRYRELRDNKRDLKKKLKKFDEEFLAQHGRNPKKSDKEVIRPMYQKYHEIKNVLEELRCRLQQGKDPIPEDLIEEILSPAGAGPQDNSSKGVRMSGDSDNEIDDLDHSMGRSKTSRAAAAAESKPASRPSPEPAPSTPTPNDATQNKASAALEALQQEKKNLHAYLKVYEKDFNRIHGRPVMKNEDILPVAGEYQRYKELKNLIRQTISTP